MASKARTLTLYLHEESAADLATAKRGGRSAGAHVRYLAELHRAIAERCLPQDLLESQLALLDDALARHQIQRIRDVTMIPYVVDEQIRATDIARRHGVDGDRFAYRLRTMKIHELIALAAAIESRRPASNTPSAHSADDHTQGH